MKNELEITIYLEFTIYSLLYIYFIFITYPMRYHYLYFT